MGLAYFMRVDVLGERVRRHLEVNLARALRLE